MRGTFIKFAYKPSLNLVKINIKNKELWCGVSKNTKEKWKDVLREGDTCSFNKKTIKKNICHLSYFQPVGIPKKELAKRISCNINKKLTGCIQYIENNEKYILEIFRDIKQYIKEAQKC